MSYQTMTTTELEQLSQELQHRLGAQEFPSLNAALSIYADGHSRLRVAEQEYQERCQIHEKLHAIREALRSRPDGATNRAWGIYPDAQ